MSKITCILKVTAFLLTALFVFSACSGSPARRAASRQPAWVDNPETVYPRHLYISRVGYGSNRTAAERDALAKLVAFFGQSVQAEMHSISIYSEAVKRGALQITENISIQNAITTSAEMNTLVGAEIADVWFDNAGTYYAVAIMERERTSALYAQLIRANARFIENLINISQQDRISLEAFSSLQLAATIADANRVYANVLAMLTGETPLLMQFRWGIDTSELHSGEELRLEAAAIARNMPIGISITGDHTEQTTERIRDAFSRAISTAGLRSGGENTRYVLNINYSISQVELPGQQNVFVRYQINSRLEDTAAGNSVLFTYEVSGRDGHLTLHEAEQRVIRTAEARIVREFEERLTSYLASMTSLRN